jgi:hypothetical protein
MHRQSMLQTARELVSRYWSLYRDRSRSRSELAFMSSGDIELYAADCGLTPGQFSDMLKRGPHVADELLDLIKALNIDEAGLKAANRGTFNDMKLICAECRRKSECRKSLRNGAAAMDYGTFCNNAELLWEARNRSKTTA